MESANGRKNALSKAGKSPDFSFLVEELLSHLNGRTREILKKRFGLVPGKEPETLEKIGKDYGITRERVRQIVADSLKNIGKVSKSVSFREAEKEIAFAIGKRNGIISEKEAVEILGTEGDKNLVRFVAECSESIRIYSEKGVLESSWIFDDLVVGKVKRAAGAAETVLKKESKPLKGEQLAERIAQAVTEITREEAADFLKVLSRVKRNKFGKWGMHDWSEISPKGSREKIYLVLKEENRPLHFTEIAKLIDKHGLSKRKAHPQTIHNELIKDGKFVLIGRGIYALREWGYSEGTIRDVIAGILKELNRPAKKEEILEKVFKAREVKKTTVMINLNNRKFFRKEGELYALK